MLNSEVCGDKCMAAWGGRCADCWMRTVKGDLAAPLFPESREYELGDLINFATIAANATEHQLDPEEADAEFNAVLVDLDSDDASFLVDLMFHQLTDQSGKVEEGEED